MVYGIGLAALVVAWLMPGHYFPWHSFQQETAAAIGVLTMALAALVSGAVRRLVLTPLSLAALATALIPLVQWCLGEIPYVADAVLPSLFLCAFAMTAAVSLALVLVDGETYVAALFIAVLCGAFVSIDIGLIQWLRLGPQPFMEDLPVGGRIYANFTQPNHLAALIGMALGAVAWLFETRRVSGGPALLAIAFLELGLVMTQARVGWIIVAMLAAWWLLGRRRAALQSTPRAIAVLVALFALMTIAWTRLNMAIDTPTATGLADRVQVMGGRGIHWPALWDAVWRRPLLGWGWMQVSAAQGAVALDHPASHEWITYSHDVFLDLLIWNGVPIGGLLIAGIVWWTASRCRACHDATTWSMLAAGGAIAVYALVEFPHAYLFFLLPLAMFVGVVEARHVSDQEAPALMVPKWAFAVATAGMAGMLGWVWIEYLEVEEMSRRAGLADVHYVVPGQEPTTPTVRLLDNQRDFIWSRITEAQPGMSAGDLERLRRASSRYLAPPVMLRYSLAAGTNGRPDEAERNLRLMCQTWPAKRCAEGRASWRALGEKYPVLRSIPYPEPGPDEALVGVGRAQRRSDRLSGP